MGMLGVGDVVGLVEVSCSRCGSLSWLSGVIPTASAFSGSVVPVILHGSLYSGVVGCVVALFVLA